MINTDKHWLAGLLEGEGSFIHRRLKKGGHLWLGVTMGTTDKDVAQRCQKIAGGTVAGPYVNGRYKPTWKWGLNRHRECIALMEELRPLMSQRRQEQIDSCREAYAAKREIPAAERTHCPQGHPYNEANTCYVRKPTGSISRSCRVCNRERSRKHRAANPEMVREATIQWRKANPERSRELARAATARYRARKKAAARPR